jgi:hypothetical protein
MNEASPEPVMHHAQGRFIASTWIICGLLLGLLFTIALFVVNQAISVSTGWREELVYLIAFSATFFVFLVVLNLRLPSIQHDRMLNSLAVGSVHVGVVLVGAAVAGFMDSSINLFDARLALIWTAPAALVACLIAPGLLPAEGDSPDGIQEGWLPTERSL